MMPHYVGSQDDLRGKQRNRSIVIAYQPLLAGGFSNRS